MSLTKQTPLSYFRLTNKIRQAKQKHQKKSTEKELKAHVVRFGIFETRITEKMW